MLIDVNQMQMDKKELFVYLLTQNELNLLEVVYDSMEDKIPFRDNFLGILFSKKQYKKINGIN